MAGATLTLAHLSDVHLSPLQGFGPRHLNIKRTLGWVNWRRKRRYIHRREVADLLLADALRHGADHIAITGDLVNIGLPAEHEAARAWLASTGAPERITVVPGNHDIYTPLLTDPGVRRWQAYMASDPRGAAFCAGLERPGGFPFVRCLGPVALIGVNSAIPTPLFRASGALGAVQIAALGDVLARLAGTELLRVIVIHHPPLPGQTSQRRALLDAPALAHTLARHGAELVLHGHNHVDSLIAAEGPAGPIPVVGVASGSTVRPNGREPSARYNLLALSGPRGRHAMTLTGRGLAADGVTVVERERRQLVSTLSPAPIGE